MQQFVSVKKTALYGMLLALAFLLGYVEHLLAFSFFVPGIKLGLANLVVLIALYTLGSGAAASLSIVRVLLSAFTFGNLTMAAYSLAGALLSLLVMLLLKKSRRCSIVGVSTAGGAAHNLGQIAVAVLMLGRPIFYYLPYLLIGGVVSGILIGLLGATVTRVVRRVAAHSLLS